MSLQLRLKMKGGAWRLRSNLVPLAESRSRTKKDDYLCQAPFFPFSEFLSGKQEQEPTRETGEKQMYRCAPSFSETVIFFSGHSPGERNSNGRNLDASCPRSSGHILLGYHEAQTETLNDPFFSLDWVTGQRQASSYLVLSFVLGAPIPSGRLGIHQFAPGDTHEVITCRNICQIKEKDQNNKTFCHRKLFLEFVYFAKSNIAQYCVFFKGDWGFSCLPNEEVTSICWCICKIHYSH